MNYFANNRSDILCLQDTHWLTDEHQLVKKSGKVNVYLMVLGPTQISGVAIMFGKNIDYKLLQLKGIKVVIYY